MPKIEDAIEFATNNEKEIRRSKSVGCYYCMRVYPASDVSPGDFIPAFDFRADERTARCPHCGVDSVIPETAGYELNAEMLRKLHEYWFTPP